LPGKQVATLARSAAVDYLRQRNAQVQEFPTPDEMFEAFLNKKVDAVVFGMQVLLYYAAHEGKGRVKLVGSQFDNAPIAIMFQLNSPLRRKVDGALLALRGKGVYQQLYDKWFGNPWEGRSEDQVTILSAPALGAVGMSTGATWRQRWLRRRRALLAIRGRRRTCMIRLRTSSRSRLNPRSGLNSIRIITPVTV
jgi:hypothetical protein